MDNTNLFESILEDSGVHISKIKESKFKHIAEASAPTADLGIFEFNDIIDYDYSEDGYFSADYIVASEGGENYSVTVNLTFDKVDVDTDCDCDNPCDCGRSPDNIRYISTGAWCEGVNIDASATYTIVDDGDPVMEEVELTTVVDFFTGKGIPVTADSLASITKEAIGKAESEYQDAIDEDPSYFCDCDNCDCDWDYDCDNCDNY